MRCVSVALCVTTIFLLGACGGGGGNGSSGGVAPVASGGASSAPVQATDNSGSSIEAAPSGSVGASASTSAPPPGGNGSTTDPTPSGTTISIVDNGDGTTTVTLPAGGSGIVLSKGTIEAGPFWTADFLGATGSEAAGTQRIIITSGDLPGSPRYVHSFDFDAATPVGDPLLPGFFEIRDGRTLPDGSPEHRLLFNDSLQFTSYGLWQHSTSPGTGALGVFAAGLPTAPSEMPKTGAAEFSGTTVGAYQGMTNGAPTALYQLAGKASMRVDFRSGAIAGSFTEMRATAAGGAPLGWYGMTWQAQITGGTSRFFGSLASNGSPPGFAQTGFIGHVSGGFNGPQANEAGGIWQAADSRHRAMGAFGVAR